MACKYLVLDLDNTLIYAKATESVGKLSNKEFSFRVLPNRNLYKVVIRDHFNTFIDTMVKKGYKLIVWSAGSEYYVKCIVATIFKNIKLHYVLTYDHLTDDKKVLTTLCEVIDQVDIDKVRLLDDNVTHKPDQEKQFIYIKPFKGVQDNDLLKAIDDIEQSYP